MHGRKPRLKYEAIGFGESKKASKKGGGILRTGKHYFYYVLGTSARASTIN